MRLNELLDADWRRLQVVSRATERPRRWRDSFGPRFAHVVLIRMAYRLHARGWPRLAKLPSLVNFCVFGIEVPPPLEIGPGLVIPHTNGTVLGAARIGSNVTVFHQVTLGAKLADFGFDLALRPQIGDEVIIAAGAKVLGPVRIGNGAVIGANAVVVDDVPAGATAVGVPARLLTQGAEAGR